jgi:hypothetical protein|tara:strand:- start:46 stop:528 length:483 start_codon:yes stop_codon:yes gene_type:complete
MKKSLLMIVPLLIWVGCAIQPSEGVAKPINYSVPPVARFNVPLLLKLNINEIEEVLGQPVNKWVPNEYQKAIGMDITSNQEWKIESTTIDVEYNNDGKIVSIFLTDSEYNLSAGSMMVRGSINPQPNVKDYSVKYQKWINPKYAKELKSSQIAGIEVKPK